MNGTFPTSPREYFTTKTITLAADIDLSSYTPWTPIGLSMMDAFDGTFDGNNKTISGLTVNTSHPTDSVYAGLFGRISSGATIKDLNVVVVSVRAEVTATTMTAYAGGVVGENLYGTVSNCHVSGGTISAEYSTIGSYNAYAGGVAGYSDNGPISKCYVSDSVTVKAVGNWNQVYAGGVLGFGNMVVIEECFNVAAVFADGDDNASAGGVAGANNGSVTASYNAGSVTASINGSSTSGYAYAGGVAGYSGGTISNCANIGDIEAASATGDTYAGGIVGGIMNGLYTSYSAGTVSATGGGTNRAGGLLAYNAAYYESMGSVQNSFYDNEKASGTLVDSATAGKSTLDMKTSSTYPTGTDWGDNTIWTLQDDYYPVLTPLANTLTVTNGTGDGSYMPYTTVTVSADAAPAGQVFEKWTGYDASAFGSVTSSPTTFTMPQSDVTVTANYVTPVIDTFIPVTNITGVQTTAQLGTSNLYGAVEPSDATNKTIVWSVSDAGTTGATISGQQLNTTNTGTVTVLATITNGASPTTDYTQSFPITVTTLSYSEILAIYITENTNLTAIAEDGVITVTGSQTTPASTTLRLDTSPEPTIKINWNAAYTCNSPFPAITVAGGGVIEFGAGSSVTNSGAGSAVTSEGDVIISGSTITANGPNATAIFTLKNVTVSSGTISANGSDGLAVFAEGDVTLTGGTVSATGVRGLAVHANGTLNIDEENVTINSTSPLVALGGINVIKPNSEDKGSGGCNAGFGFGLALLLLRRSFK
ncbi:hypothetical protein FACS1894187_23020 [Synergistales bacterium]|nr:hypothetical protein FACS1894187_23020 [Synergistales bacterium]